MQGFGGFLGRNYVRIVSLSTVSLPLLAMTGCGPTPAPRAYYATSPSVMVVSPPAPATTTHYVYGTINSTNTTHITSESTVHVYSNHPTNDQPVPPAISQTTDETQTTTEPTPPEEQTPRPEPSVDEPATPPEPEPAAEPTPEPEPDAAPAPEPEPDATPAPEPEPSAPSSDDTNK